MSIDVSQFHLTFLEEAGENLQDLETGLLALEDGSEADMNAIFRAAHSIKGGAATFGFQQIADFTHVAESVLEKARDGELEVKPELVTELLKGVDVIGELLDNAKAGDTETPAPDQTRCLQELEKYLSGGQGAPAPSSPAGTADDAGDTGTTAPDAERIVNISFKPKPHLPQTGSDPKNILRELSELGEMTAECKVDQLPPLAEINAEELYLWWDIELVTSANDDVIQDVFLFVEDDCDIDIMTLAAIDPMPVEGPTATPMPERRKGDRRAGADRRDKAKPENSSIRVAIDKVDNLLNLVGELVTTNAMVMQRVTQMSEEDKEAMLSVANEMSVHTRSLQEAIMGIRMMPVDFAFSRFPRMVRDTANKLDKEVKLVTEGAQTELDKTVIEKITDPLTHLVRNAVDHGIETPAERAEANKPTEGTVILSAFYRGGNVVIEIRDDGKGLDRDKIVAKAIEKGVTTPEAAKQLPDEEVWNFIFDSGFSTAAEVTDVSGRGVGMDVVRKNIQALGGSVHITSEKGKGSIFAINLPLTLAILDGMATKVGDEIYIVPLLSILESLRPTASLIKQVQQDVEVLDFRGEYIPLLRLSEVLEVQHGAPVMELSNGIAVVVESEQGKVALFVDDLLGERQVVIKNIEKNYVSVEGVSGATIMGDGRVALIVDLAGLVRRAAREGRYVKGQTQTVLQRSDEESFGVFEPPATTPPEGATT